MPLRDHFHPPLSIDRPWDGIHSAWATNIAALLNRDHLPEDYFALPQVTVEGRVEIDVATIRGYEVQVMQQLGGPRLRAAVELVSPANKDRASHRRAFVVKCAAYLQRGVSVVLVDGVTERLANMHEELVSLLDLGPALQWTSGTHLYAIAYRTATGEAHDQLEIWPAILTIGQALPTLPLWLGPELVVPLELEASYETTCAAMRVRP